MAPTERHRCSAAAHLQVGIVRHLEIGIDEQSRHRGFASSAARYPERMIILGLILILIGALTNIGILYTLGAVLAIVGVVLWILGSTGRAIGGRSHYW
jgi:hypothetical protein